MSKKRNNINQKLYESVEQKKRRLYGKVNIKSYISEIKKIILTNDIKLLTIVETDFIFNKCSTLVNIYNKEFLFSDKSEIKNIILNFYKNDNIKYLYTFKSTDCGIIELESISDFNFNFKFNDNEEGLIGIIDFNFQKRILLDFFIDNNTEKLKIDFFDSGSYS